MGPPRCMIDILIHFNDRPTIWYKRTSVEFNYHTKYMTQILTNKWSSISMRYIWITRSALAIHVAHPNSILM